MLERLARTLFWDQRLSSRLLQVWAVVILLAPVALTAAIWLQLRIAGRLPVKIEIDRDRAIAIAHRFAQSQGIDSNGFVERVTLAEKKWDIYRYLVRQGESGRTILHDLSPWNVLEVRLDKQDRTERVQVHLGSGGQILGYELRMPEMPSAASSRDLAMRALAERRRALPSVEAGKLDESTPHKFVWELQFGGLSEMTGRLTVRVQGNRVVEDVLKVSVRDDRFEPVSGFGKGLLGFYVAVLAIFILYRYIKRRIQKEVSWERMVLVAGLVAAVFTASIYLSDGISMASQAERIPPVFVLALVAFGGLLIGMVGGIVYTASEGDLRETYPHVLHSLDALLSGKLLARQVGRAVLLGTVMLSWQMFLCNALYWVAGGELAGLDVLEDTSPFLFTKVPWLSLLLEVPRSALFLTLAALLCPLVALQRRVKQPLRLMLAIGAVAWFVISQTANVPAEQPYFALITLLEAAVTVYTFFAVDFLSSFFLLAAYGFLVRFVGVSQIAPAFAEYDSWLLAGCVLLLAALVWAAFYGKVAREADVRPAYASQIQERLQLQSEVAAAREAQQRLLPASPPRVPGLSIAGSCRAAEVVSGDFYDFFDLGSRKVGILLSDGGGNGLATALSIAMTKGFLMHRAQAGLSPAETLRGVPVALGRELEGFSAEGLCYAIADLNEATVRYARYGDTPCVLSAAGEVVEFQRDQMWEGTIRLAPGQPVILYTNGVSRLLGVPDGTSTNRWLRKRLEAEFHQPPDLLHEFLMRTLFQRRIGLGMRTAEEDVTVIVLSLDREQVATRERVA